MNVCVSKVDMSIKVASQHFDVSDYFFMKWKITLTHKISKIYWIKWTLRLRLFKKSR